MKISCNIIRDLLPLYVDDVVCDETKKLIEEHITLCKECMKEVENMGKTVILPNDNDNRQIKKLNRKMTKKRIITVCISIFLTTIILIGLFMYLFVIGYSVSSDDVIVTTEIQYSDNTYLNQEWNINFSLSNERTLQVFRKYVYNTNEEGNEILTGIVIYVREIPIGAIAELGAIVESDKYTWGYSINDEIIPDDFDVTVSVVYSDQTIVYSLREEGLFEKQKNLG